MFFLITASILYAAGGICMKSARGFQEIVPSLLVFFFFSLAAGIQIWAMKNVDLSKGYLLVAGMEGVFAIFAGVFYFGEKIALLQGIGSFLILLGILFLRL